MTTPNGRTMQDFPFAGRPVGVSHPPLVVAELSANHGSKLERAIETIRVAKECGADAVKLQTYRPDTMTIRSDRRDFVIQDGLWAGHNLYDLYARAHTPWEWHEALFAAGREFGIPIFSTPFDSTAVDLLEKLGNPVYKIASFEAVDLPLIGRIADTGKPIILSTGLTRLHEIAQAVDKVRAGRSKELMLLHCISSYPAEPHQFNLRTIPNLSAAFQVQVGLSDHSVGTAVAAAAVAFGACMFEKHFTLERDDGPDASFSATPDELTQYVKDIRAAWAACGEVSYQRTPAELGNRIFQRSIYAVADIPAGERLNESNTRIIRPGYGLPPAQLPHVLGRRAKRVIARGEAISWDLLD
jgi:pseudaminic acid synthase